MEDIKKIQEFFSKPLNEYSDENFDSLEDAIANSEFGMDYNQLGPGEKEWVRDEMSMNEMDMNDPVLMKMRAAKDAVRGDSPASQGKRASIGDDISRVSAKKIAFLKKERAQLIRDMEQEAEPEGGPITDEYGSKLNRIDKAIVKLSGRKEMTYDQAIAEAKVDYDFSERELIRVLRQLKRGASGEIEMINAFKKALGRDITKDELFSEAIAENKILKQAKLSSAEYQKAKKLKDFNEDDYEWNPSESLYVKEKKSKFKKHGEMSGFDMRGIDEASRARVSMPRFVKDKNNPNFLNVYIDYSIGAGGSSIALGKETMTGQIRRESAAEAMRLAGDVARDLEAEYNLEDIDVTDLGNGKVRVFAVSDDFIDRDPNMLGEAKIGDKVKINKEYGGDKGTIEDIVGSFVVVNGKSYHESDVEKVGLDEEKEDKNKKPLSKPIAKDLGKMKTNFNDLKKRLKLETLNEDQFAAELDGFADQLAAEIKDELEDHKEEIQKSDKEVNEIAGVVGIIGYILLSNTVANMLSKFAKKQFAKHDFGKGEAAAKKIYNFTHKNEESFKAPIKRIVGMFTKDEKKKTIISDILYAIVILLMAGQAGGDAVSYIKKAGYIKGGLYGLKSAIKGTEVATILKGVVADAVS